MRARLVSRARSESGQDLVEYAGVLLFVAALIGAIASLGIAANVARAVECEVQRIELNACSSGPALSTTPSTSGTVLSGADRATLEQTLGTNSLIDACAGGTQPNPVAEANAPDSAACKQALAKLTPHAKTILALLAATLQAQEPGNHGSFALLLQSYLAHPGWAVIALSPRAQAEQAGGNNFLDKLQNTPGDVLDGFLGSLCDGYGLCLGGNATSQAYQQAWHASAQINQITTPVLLATGIGGVLKDVVGAGLKAVLAKLGPGEASQVERAVGELESGAERQTAGGGGDLLALPRGEPELTHNALEHIVSRHFPASDAPYAGEFADGTTGQEVKSMIREAVQDGSFRPNTGGRSGTIYEYDFGHTIGVSRAGNPTSNLRVVVGPNGQVITAFPY